MEAATQAVRRGSSFGSVGLGGDGRQSDLCQGVPYNTQGSPTECISWAINLGDIKMASVLVYSEVPFSSDVLFFSFPLRNTSL